MKIDEYVVVDGKKMRCGYTTGTCALATTTAALESLKTNKTIEMVRVMTPAGIELHLEVEEIYRTGTEAKYSIIKDAGDDPDATNGLAIHSTVRIRDDGKIFLDGGKGVGRICKKGLFGQVGEAAINPVPKKLILETLNKYNETGLYCLIEVPEGKRVGEKTFNPYMGIKGGISILGTKGIVYPMSKEAYVRSMYIEIDMVKEEGHKEIVLTPGNYGKEIAHKRGLQAPIVQVSNFFGDTLRYAESKGFKKISVIGHIGKLAKMSIGIFNTHSAIADTRMEAFVYYLVFMGAKLSLIEKVNQAISAEEALLLCIQEGYSDIVKKMEEGCKKRIIKHIRNEDLEIEVIIYSMNEEGKR